MRARRAGIALAVIHVLLVGTLGLKLLADRARLPRAWARTVPIDPDLLEETRHRHRSERGRGDALLPFASGERRVGRDLARVDIIEAAIFGIDEADPDPDRAGG